MLQQPLTFASLDWVFSRLNIVYVEVKVNVVSVHESPLFQGLPHLYIFNGWDVCVNGTTSVPKSVLRYSVDKVRQESESEV